MNLFKKRYWYAVLIAADDTIKMFSIKSLIVDSTIPTAYLMEEYPEWKVINMYPLSKKEYKMIQTELELDAAADDMTDAIENIVSTTVENYVKGILN